MKQQHGTDASPANGWWEPALLGLLVCMTAASAGLMIWQSITAEPIRIAGLTLDRLSAALTLLVASVGAGTFRFSQRYLDGEPGKPRFLMQLFFAVASAYVLMLSSNLLILFAAWSMTSLALHGLLTHYPERVEALRPARKKFLISRLGDVALVAAIARVRMEWGTLDLHEFLERVAASGEGDVAVAILIVVAALTKSAQFPFHSWLPETMESPTPVSALMHAGIINAGGALLLRFAPLLIHVPIALLLLSAVGTLTAVVGMIAMWAQVKVKRTLAWSTVSQMGFMMVQCGLAAFPAAFLHMLGHGFYKAWSFLRAGDVPPPTPTDRTPSPGSDLFFVALGTAVSIPAMWLASRITGFDPLHSPGELALSAIVALSFGQLWAALLSGRPLVLVNILTGLGSALLLTAAGSLVAFALYRGAGLFLRPVLGELSPPSGPLAWCAAALPVLGLVALTLIRAALPAFSQTSAGRAFYVHALHGFYFGAIADRAVETFWNRFFTPAKEAANA